VQALWACDDAGGATFARLDDYCLEHATDSVSQDEADVWFAARSWFMQLHEWDIV